MAAMLEGVSAKEEEAKRKFGLNILARPNLDAYSLCGGSKNVTWIRNDLLEPWTAREYKKLGLPFWVPDPSSRSKQNASRIKVSCAHRVVGSICEDFISHVADYDLIVMSSGLHVPIRSDGIFGKDAWSPDAFLDDMRVTAKRVAARVFAHAKVVLRTNAPGHSGCAEAVAAVTPFSSPVEADRADAAHPWYRSRLLPLLNTHLKRVAAEHRFLLLDVYEAGLQARQRHCGKKVSIDGTVDLDCLHYCVPGPVDSWVGLLLEILSSKAGMTGG
eukprot:CAMPEP_0172603812 /NCGR_PEP_ID=MMETSP1068-20121228/24063_1 /TAXON_ID=35684 /ORGANISM="Pseudopedinella elastica, Strain CCMP716" /LENGTH=272 /DNA_ID=CAMNT_0013405691 /DNA_START=17 /DNA_END=835 /DNA_ORIENTATION=+